MVILVTGGTVFASRYTAGYFASMGHEVFVLNRGTKPQPENVTPIIADRHSLDDTLRNRHFDAVIDVTAYNADDVNCLLDGLGSFGCYILVSSSAVYPETLPQPFKEDGSIGVNSIWGKYGTDKIAAEQALRSRVPDAYILRPPYLCGPMNNLHREAFVFECAEQGRSFYLPKDGSMKLQFFHIGDMCRFMELLIEKKPKKHIFNVGYPEAVTVKEWVNLCYETVGEIPVFNEVYDDIPQRSYFPFYDYEYTLDVAEMLELMPVLTPLSRSLTESYEWFRENRGLIIRKPLMEFIDANKETLK
ncbi:NAD-dependent epimerase/dehydratase family protein [Ruminococcus sp.]|uniref:NAD-dependent epimerase/dehydratase family protein n=1 Tax=Ruminococcus sp. TaxID=41978 RepID=UPI0025F31D41|nr:NAD-dependent epimerase/dehydratase family protein [Ruminococcus sp.]MBR1433168.1 NAD-dependent epimerase/dehydratase family protein [Ruminococcus sp.]